jgi:hypothetical protein
MWTLLFFIILALVLFNFGINIFTLKRRRFLLPEGKDPGFIWAAKRIGRRGAKKVPPVRLDRPGSEGRPFRARPSTTSIRPAIKRPPPILDLSALDDGPKAKAPSPAPSGTKKGTGVFGFGRRKEQARPPLKEGDRSLKGINEILEDL